MFVKISKWIVSKLYYLSYSDRLHYWSQWSGILLCIALLLQLHRYNGIGSYIKYEFYVLLPVMALPVVLQVMAILARWIVDYDLADYFETTFLCIVSVPFLSASFIPERLNLSWTDPLSGSLNPEPFLAISAITALSVLAGFVFVWFKHLME